MRLQGFERFLFNEDSVLNGSVGEAPPQDPPSSPTETDAAAKLSQGLKDIYGEITPQFPEGLEDTFKLEPAIKPFVDKEGKFNASSLIKSYVETKKMMGSDKVKMINDKSTPEEVDAFWEKLGWMKEADKYSLTKGEKSVVGDAFLNDFKKFAHDNKIPVSTAQGMVKFLEGKIDVENNNEIAAQTAKIQEGVDSLKKEYGQAFDYKVDLAKRLLREALPEKDMDMFSDPAIGSNPAVVRAMVAIASKVYKEDGFSGGVDSNALTPNEARVKINEIMADMKGPYWNKQDPRHLDVMKEMETLHKWKNSIK